MMNRFIFLTVSLWTLLQNREMKEAGELQQLSVSAGVDLVALRRKYKDTDKYGKNQVFCESLSSRLIS